MGRNIPTGAHKQQQQKHTKNNPPHPRKEPRPLSSTSFDTDGRTHQNQAPHLPAILPATATATNAAAAAAGLLPPATADTRRADGTDVEKRRERHGAGAGAARRGRPRGGGVSPHGRVPRGQGLDDGVQEGRVRGDHELVVDLRFTVTVAVTVILF